MLMKDTADEHEESFNSIGTGPKVSIISEKQGVLVCIPFKGFISFQI